MKPLLYISGPYTASTHCKRDRNIITARERMIAAMISNTWWPVCPHTHTARMEDYAPAVSWDQWLQLDIAMLAGCDALWATIPHDAPISNGVALEIAWAILADMPLLVEQVALQHSAIAPTLNADHTLNAEMGIAIDTKTILRCFPQQFLQSAGSIAKAAVAGEIPDPSHYKGSRCGGKP